MGYQKYDSFIETGNEWLGEIPESWKLVKAKWLFKEKSIKGFPDERLLSVSKGRGLIPRDELEFKTVMAFKDLENFKLVKQNDFVIHLRSFQSGFEMSDITGIVSPAYTVFEGEEDVCPYYYKYLFYTKHFIDAIASTTQSLRDGKPIAYGEFGKMELPLPSKEVQSKISDFIDEKLQSIDKLIVDKTNLIKLLEEKRQAIITEAVTKGLNPNVKMKDSCVEWIGEIPEHWEVKKIKYACRLRNEKAEAGCNLEFLGLENIESKTGKLLRDVEAENNEGTANLYYKGDVLFGKLRPYLTKCILAESNGKCTTEALVLEVNSEMLNNKFLKYLLLSHKFIDEVNSSTYGAKMPRASWGFIGNTTFPLPSLGEQREIIYELESKILNLDEVTSIIKEQIKKLKEYRQSLIYEVVTGKIDVRDIEINP